MLRVINFYVDKNPLQSYLQGVSLNQFYEGNLPWTSINLLDNTQSVQDSNGNNVKIFCQIKTTPELDSRGKGLPRLNDRLFLVGFPLMRLKRPRMACSALGSFNLHAANDLREL